LTTEGFTDVLEIGRGRWGGDIHDLLWVKPPPLVPRQHRLPLTERIDAKGSILVPLDPAEVRKRLREFDAAGVHTVAVCLLNAYANPEHERLVGSIAKAEFPHLTLSISFDVLPEIREYERTSTTVVNAYLRPVVGAYLDNLEHALGAAGCCEQVLVMQSNGGLASADRSRERPVDIVESGPAGGVLACCYLAQQIGEPNLIAFDMGGTTAKSSLIENGQPFISLEYTVGGGMSHSAGGGHPIRVPSIDIAEVGSGGGSIAWLDTGGSLRVGPRSSGAAPGPACYGLGGTEPTVTDAYAALGYLNPRAIAGGVRPIDPSLAQTAIMDKIATPAGMSVEDAAHGIFLVATSNMMRAVRAVTVERGRDARDYLLVAFGGAGPMHAAALAAAMGVKRVLVPNTPGLFSALGVLMADVQRVRSRTLLRITSTMDEADASAAAAILGKLEQDVVADLEREGFASAQINVERTAAMQYLGQSDEIIVAVPPGPLDIAAIRKMAETFSQEHERAYGYREEASRVQLVSLRATGCGSVAKPDYADIGRQTSGGADGRTATRRVYFGPQLGWHDARIVERSTIGTAEISGPAVIEDLDATILVPPACTAKRDGFGNIIITLPDQAAAAVSDEINATALELVKNNLSSITDEMAATLARTARSLIMRDSHDFSVALCNAKGELVTSGIGIAVHLGAIPNAMSVVLERFGDRFAPGDVIITNDPYSGGMHLPDIFVFRPIFIDGVLFGFAAATAHMADIGGRVPGGNAADSTDIYQEGLRIPLVKLFSAGELNQDWVDLIRANVRQADIVLGDLFAEVAACNRAEIQVRELCAHLGADYLQQAMTALIEYGERVSRAAIATLSRGRTSFSDQLDDDGVGGDPVTVAVTVDVTEDGIVIDFTGSSPQVRSAINAPMTMSRSVAAFVVKAVIGSEIPNNAGFLRLIEIVAPEGSVANMSFPAACAARAVTAYRMMDALFGAFASIAPTRVPAAGDGGPAVITVGGEDHDGAPFVFMELISGSFGARPNADGLEGVAAPIVNAKNTSCELIEATFPIRVEHYGFVSDTGGSGQYRGGLAIRRDVRFLGQRAVLQIRSDRSHIRPWGLAGGEPGTMSRNVLVTPDGQQRILPSKLVLEIGSGTVWRHVTAGGGGWGEPAKRDHAYIEHDVVEGKLSPSRSRQFYGWVPRTAAAVDRALDIEPVKAEPA
jgi:N-methylhydantoinase A/oxoprolinase/acetone carboxylase beta subunit/N-methylhydantoinase B/oxoprolinase/acetone carboxylase alpha subunit